MILLVTNRDDLTADWLIVELQRRDVDYVRFNTEDYPQRCSIRWRVDAASLTIGSSKLRAKDITAVWYRRPVAPRPRPGLSPDEEAWVVREASAALDGFWRTLDARWVSQPDAIHRADSKPQQLADASKLGFEIPDTEITSDVEHVRALLNRSGVVVCKPLRDGRVRRRGRSLLFTSRIELDDLGSVLEEPYLFQGLVPKRYDIRVTVIGDAVLAARIETDGAPDGRIDWRRAPPADVRYAPEELPDDLADRCRLLVNHYGLAFGALDLARRPDGGYTFFELNPNGQWAFVEQRTGLPLRARLVDVLLDVR